MEEVRIKLGCADTVEFEYVEGRREGFLSRRNNEQWHGSGTQWNIKDVVNSMLWLAQVIYIMLQLDWREYDPPSPKNHFIKESGWQEKGRDKELSIWVIVNVFLGSEGGLRAGH